MPELSKNLVFPQVLFWTFVGGLCLPFFYINEDGEALIDRGQECQMFCNGWSSVKFIQSLSHVQLFTTPRTAACQASLSLTKSQRLFKLMSIEEVMPSNPLILCCLLLLLPSIFPSIRVFSNESVVHIRWPKYWSFSFSISTSSEYSGLISFRMDWLNLLQSKGLSRAFSNTTVQKHQSFGVQLSL